MTTANLTKPDASFNEAPASWFTRYLTPEGFTCQITIRGENGRDLLDKAGVAIAYLLEHGYKPDGNSRNHYSNNNKGQDGGKLCPIHQCELKRFEKDGRTWYSHKLEDGTWCRGKAK